MVRFYKTSGSDSWRIRNGYFCVGNYLPVNASHEPVFLGDIVGDLKSLTERELKEKFQEIHFETYRPTALGVFRILSEINEGDFIVATLPGRKIRIYRVKSSDIVYRRLAKDLEEAKRMLERREPWEEFCIQIEPVKEAVVDDILYSKLTPRMTISRIRDESVKNAILRIIMPEDHK